MARNNSSPVQQFRGTTAQHATYTGLPGELTVDTDKNVVVVHDGVTAGGHPMASADAAASSIDPWNIFPMRVPIAVDGVTFGGSDGRRAIMPGESEPRENWVKCDGGSDGQGGSVPNLQGRFIRGASDSVPAGSTGGSETHSHSLSGTVGATTLTVEQLASHGHGINIPTEYNGEGTRFRQWVDTKSGNTSATGGSQPHTHDLTGAFGEANGLPPYYALSFIIRTS